MVAHPEFKFTTAAVKEGKVRRLPRGEEEKDEEVKADEEGEKITTGFAAVAAHFQQFCGSAEVVPWNN